MGIGTVVGLGITAGAAAVAKVGVAGGAGVASHLVARLFNRVCNTFQSIKEEFDGIHTDLRKLQTSMLELKGKMMISVEDDVDNVSANVTDHIGYEQFCCLFDVLLKGVREARDRRWAWDNSGRGSCGWGWCCRGIRRGLTSGRTAFQQSVQHFSEHQERV